MTEWPRRFALLVWVVILAGVFGRVAVARVGAQSVVPIYLAAGERWWTGEPLYAPPPGMDVYRNPPGFAALFAPLAQLPPRAVALLWRAVGIGLFALGLRRFVAAVNPMSLGPRRTATVWIVAAALVLPAFNNGQVNLFVVAAALLGTAAAVRGHWWRASAWPMLATWLKVYPLALAGLILLLAPGRLAWRMPLTLAAMLALPFACQNPEYVWNQTGEFLKATRSDERGGASLDRTLKGWTYLARVAAGEVISPEVLKLAAAVSGLLLAGTVILASRRNGSEPALYGLALCAALLWMVVFGPATETNTYSILAPLGWLAVLPRQPRANRLLAGAGLALVLAASIGATVPGHPDIALASLQPLGAIAMFGAAIRALLALRPDPSSGTI